MLNKDNRWLLLRENNTDYELKLDVFVDSDVTLATRVSNTEFDLHEVYKRGASEQLIVNKIGGWEESRGIQLETTSVIAIRRMNLHQSVIKAVLVVSFSICDDSRRVHEISISYRINQN